MIRIGAALLGLSIVLAGITPLARAADYKVVHLFPFDGDGPSGDGANPAASLIDVGGTLYGTTEQGGNGFGAVFSLNPATGTEELVYSFIQGVGFVPMASLTDFRGILFGTTETGGNKNDGVVFSLNPATGVEQLVLSFAGGKHGKYPAAGLTQIGGTLYGTTTKSNDHGCQGGCGIIYALNPNTGAEKTLHQFVGGTDGAYPYADLIDVGGTLYGTTSQGGTGHGGTIFSLDPSTGAYQILYSFQEGSGSTDGSDPRAGLIDVGGTLYGTTLGGSNSPTGTGTIFSLNLATGVEKILHFFQNGEDGSAPYSTLIHVGGKLYGTTSEGGIDPNGNCGPGCGTVFSLDLATGREKVLYSFQGSSANDGAYPLAALIDVGGTLYGTTSAGGVSSCYNNYVSGCGTVFSIKP